MASSSKRSDEGRADEGGSEGEGVDEESGPAGADESMETKADGGKSGSSPNWAEVEEEVGLDESTADAKVDEESLDGLAEQAEQAQQAQPGSDGKEDGESKGERVGDQLAGRYDLVEFIERGAMGEVYQAEHSLMKKKVAIKILHSEVTGQGKIVERFRREAQAAANIDHPNVCIATDFGRTDSGEFFLVMEYLEGETLKEVIDREGRFELDRALHIAHQITSALARAHEVGVIHRDLKPDNIMLVERGDDPDFVKILDFGIARVRMEDQTPELTKTGAVFGTPSYMSPEQAAGDPLDHRADLYALGNVIFEMVAGRRVFEADRGAQVMAMHVSKDPPRPSEVIEGGIEADLEALILALLDKEPDERPQTAGELLEELEEFGAGVDLFGGEDHEQEGPVATTRPPPMAAPGPSGDAVGDDPSEWLTWGLDTVSNWFKRQGATARWAALGLLAVGVVMVGTLLVVVAVNSRAGAAREGAAVEANRGLDEARRRYLARPQLRPVRREFQHGAYGAVLREIERLKADGKGASPHLAYLEGRAHAERDEWAESLASFKEALEQEPRYLQDRQLLEGLVGALGRVDGEVSEQAREVLAERIDRERVRTTLARIAWRGGSSRLRRRTYRLLRDQEVFGDLPDWVQASIELRHSHGCDQHRERINRLIELGDPRGLEVLRMYDNFRRRGCGEHDQTDCFGCIRSDIARAMKALRSELAPQPHVTAGGGSGDDAGTEGE